MLFAYATYRLDPVFMLGQGMGLFIYARNIQLIWQQKASQKGNELVDEDESTSAADGLAAGGR